MMTSVTLKSTTSKILISIAWTYRTGSTGLDAAPQIKILTKTTAFHVGTPPTTKQLIVVASTLKTATTLSLEAITTAVVENTTYPSLKNPSSAADLTPLMTFTSSSRTPHAAEMMFTMTMTKGAAMESSMTCTQRSAATATSSTLFFTPAARTPLKTTLWRGMAGLAAEAVAGRSGMTPLSSTAART